MKSFTSFVCQECGYDSPEWLGKCPECGNWNSFREIKTGSLRESVLTTSIGSANLEPKRISQIKFEKKERLSTSFSEADTVLGGGIVRGSVTLLAGDPGIGKSTLLLQIAMNIASSRGPARSFPATPVKQASSFVRSASARSRNTDVRAVGSPSTSVTPRKLEVSSQNSEVLYISGEESEEQIKMRALRLRGGTTKDDPKSLLLISLSNINAAVEVIENVSPALVIIDSIQTMESENLTGLAGSVGQVRYATGELIKTAKRLGIPIIIVGHVTKEGMVAGPMILSHMVDTLLFLEGEKYTRTRILRSLKNRFGPIDEVGVFTMDEKGMVEAKNPESLFIEEKKEDTPGSVLVVTLEGTRAFLVEIQALVVFSKLPMPRRVASGIETKRLELLLAVLQKHGKIPVDTMDVYVNVAGGLKLSDPAADLGICLAILSSFRNIAMGRTVAVAEVGLLGELRRVADLEKRVKEAKKLGFSNIIGADKYKSLNEVIGKLT